VNLILRDVRRDPSDDRYVWTPYELNEEFNGDWWDSPPYSIDDPHYVKAILAGVEVARRLVESYPNRRFLALSEDADEFWATLGWNRYDYHDGPHQYRPLFIAPP